MLLLWGMSLVASAAETDIERLNRQRREGPAVVDRRDVVGSLSEAFAMMQGEAEGRYHSNWFRATPEIKEEVGKEITAIMGIDMLEIGVSWFEGLFKEEEDERCGRRILTGFVSTTAVQSQITEQGFPDEQLFNISLMIQMLRLRLANIEEKYRHILFPPRAALFPEGEQGQVIELPCCAQRVHKGCVQNGIDCPCPNPACKQNLAREALSAAPTLSRIELPKLDTCPLCLERLRAPLSEKYDRLLDTIIAEGRRSGGGKVGSRNRRRDRRKAARDETMYYRRERRRERPR